jgi:hypothetical protein
MKKCPYCAEEIQEEAVKCRFCGEFFPPKTATPAREPWYYRNSSIFIGFLCVGPLVLPLVWLHPRYSWPMKIVITTLMVVLTWILLRWLSSSLANLQELLRQLQNPG